MIASRTRHHFRLFLSLTFLFNFLALKCPSYDLRDDIFRYKYCKSGNSINRSVTIDGNNFIDLLLSMLSHSFACQNKNLFLAIERCCLYKKRALKLSCNLSHKHINSFTSHDSFYELWKWDKKSIKVTLSASRWGNFLAWWWKNV